jgi:hypothetical protein
MRCIGGVAALCLGVQPWGGENLRLQPAAPPHVNCRAQAEEIEELWRGEGGGGGLNGVIVDHRERKKIKWHARESYSKDVVCYPKAHLLQLIVGARLVERASIRDAHSK